MLGGYHPVPASLGFDDLPGLAGLAAAVCSNNPGPFQPRSCPDGIAAELGSCYGLADCTVGPEPVESEVLGLRLAKGQHAWPQLDQIVDLERYLWARLSTARKPLLAIGCTDTVADVYATPVAEAAAVPEGTILRCASLDIAGSDSLRPLSVDELAEILEEGAPGVEVLTGVRPYLVSYRTNFDAVASGVGSAVIVLPDQPAPGPLPLIVGAHGTAGLADACAPSKTDVINLVLSWAAIGYPAVMPDYAGLGTEGIQPTASLTAVARSLLDGARALRNAAPAGLSDGRVVLSGHSQGGGGALIAQGLAGSYAPDLELAAVVAFGALYDPNHPLSAALVPAFPIGGGGGVLRAVAAAAVYSTAAVVVGEDAAAGVFQEGVRDFTADALRNLCAEEVIPRLDTDCFALEPPDVCSQYVPAYQRPNTVGEMFTAGTLSGLAACLVNLPTCTDAYRAMVDLTTTAVPLNPQGADMLFLAGSNDVAVPLNNVLLSINFIQGTFGLTPDLCVSADDHDTVTAAQTAYQQRWVLAKLAGEAPPACPAGGWWPGCTNRTRPATDRHPIRRPGQG